MIPFLDIQAQYEAIRSELELAVLDVLKGGEYAYENLDYKVGDFPVSTSETLSLPICPEMTSLQVEKRLQRSRKVMQSWEFGIAQMRSTLGGVWAG